MTVRRLIIGATVAALSVTASATACTGSTAKASGPATFHVDRPTALADTAVDIRLTGLKAHQRVTLGASALDYGGGTWTSHADFTADGSGAIDLATAAPAPGGSYTGVDGMGLVWSVTTTPTNPKNAGFHPAGWPAPFTVDVVATADGKQIAKTTLTRDWQSPGVTARKLTLDADKVYGDVFLPPADAEKHPAVLIFGGSEGGESMRDAALLLASHGFPALALAYWKEPGLPTALRDIPLEYFQTAGKLLAAQPGVDPAHVLAIGYSRGSEAALQSAQYFPDVFHGAVVYSPSSDANRGFPDGPHAWTLGGKPVTIGAIPVDHISGPVYAIVGAYDHIWPSDPSANSIMDALDLAHDRFPHQKWSYPEAGHGVGTYPYFPTKTSGTHPVTGKPTDFGGTVAGDQQGRADSWRRLLGMLGGLESS